MNREPLIQGRLLSWCLLTSYFEQRCSEYLLLVAKQPAEGIAGSLADEEARSKLLRLYDHCLMAAGMLQLTCPAACWSFRSAPALLPVTRWLPTCQLQYDFRSCCCKYATAMVGKVRAAACMIISIIGTGQLAGVSPRLPPS